MERKIYSCDWCCVDAPDADSIGDGWEILQNPTNPSDGAKVTLCAKCFGTACRAWEVARNQRFRETHPEVWSE